jgi:hypothetical protein
MRFETWVAATLALALTVWAVVATVSGSDLGVGAVAMLWLIGLVVIVVLWFAAGVVRFAIRAALDARR